MTGARSTAFPNRSASSATRISRSCGHPRRGRDVRVALGLVIACALAGLSCGNEPTAKGAKPAAAAAAADGEICKEHGVLESICTKCNPKLIPVFQAKGDWCPEHGFPESVCPICHPERGGRPAADVGTDGAPADGTKVRLKATDTARIAGIE